MATMRELTLQAQRLASGIDIAFAPDILAYPVVGAGLKPAPTSGDHMRRLYRIQTRQDAGRSRHWTTVEEGAAERPFLLDDGTGQCLVEPAGAQLKLHRRVRWEGPHRDPRQRQTRFTWLGTGGLYRFTEERIHEGDPVYLLGRFDRNGDGQISLEAWERVRQEAARISADMEDRLQRKSILSRVAETGDPGSPFLISTYPVEDLVSGLRWRALGLTAGFVGAATLLGLSLLGRFGGD